MSLDTFPGILALLVVVVAAPLNWLVTVLLWRLSRRSPEIRTLRDRAIVATSVAIIVTVFGLIFLNNDLPTPLLNLDQTRLVTRSAILAISIIPAVFWLRLYQTSK